MVKPVVTSIRSVVMRMCGPVRRTLPSSPAPTFRARAISAMVAGLSWNEKAEVRAATRRAVMRLSALMSSSEMPSEKYFWAGSLLRLVKARMATEWGGGVKGGWRGQRMVAAAAGVRARVQAARARRRGGGGWGVGGAVSRWTG